MEQLLRAEADDEFDHGAGQGGYEEHKRGAVDDGPGEVQHGYHAVAVNGAQRPQKEAAVNELTVPEGGIDDLRAPAQKAVYKEKSKQLIYRIIHPVPSLSLYREIQRRCSRSSASCF